MAPYLGIKRVDVALIHDIDRVSHGERQPLRFREAMEGAYPALAELKRAGVVGAIGLGVNETAVCIEALAHADLDCCLIAGRYTLLDNAALDDLLPLCRVRGVGLIVGGPFNSGVLAASAAEATFDYGPVPEAIAGRVRGIRRVCEAFAVPLAAAALQFPLGEPAVASVIPGARTAEEVRQNVDSFGRTIPAAFWEALKAERLLRPDAPVPT